MKVVHTLLFCTAVIIGGSSIVSADTPSSKASEYPFTVNGTWEVPQASLPAGKYVISVRDRLLDRHIFQVRDANGKVYSTFMAVPFHGTPGGPFNFWNVNGATKVVRTFKPANEDQSWELVYPKDRAVQIATDAKNPVPAVILPDSLNPANPFLSDRDMQSIQMWMLTPKRVSGNVQMAVAKIGKTAPPAPSAAVASTEAPETQRMPHTASGFADSILCGSILLMFGLTLGFSRNKIARADNR